MRIRLHLAQQAAHDKEAGNRSRHEDEQAMDASDDAKLISTDTRI